MKKFVIASSLLVLVIALSLVFSNSANATVGGPTLVYNLQFDQKTGLIYYVEQNYGGKGCPPELKTLSVDTKETTTIYSCNDRDYSTNTDQWGKIYEHTRSFTSLTPIHLKKNNINVSMEIVDVKEIEEWVSSTDFKVHFFQNDVNKASIPFTGCSALQPIIVQGYRIPGITDKILLLLSGKGNCFEGGYISESLHIVSGFQITDESVVSNYKENFPLIPYDGNLIAYVESTPQESSDIPTDNKKIDESLMILILAAVMAFLAGIFLGRLSKKSEIIQS